MLLLEILQRIVCVHAVFSLLFSLTHTRRRIAAIPMGIRICQVNNLFDPGHEITVSSPHTRPHTRTNVDEDQGVHEQKSYSKEREKKTPPENTSNYIKTECHICTRTQHVKRQDNTRTQNETKG